MFWSAVAASMLLIATVVTLKYLVLPNLEDYQGDIISRVATASGMDVSASAIRGGWSGFRPYVELENVVFRETAESTVVDRPAGAEALRLPRMTASLSWWSLLVRQIRFVDVSLIGPELALSRGKDGLIYFAGRALNAPREEPDSGRLLEFLLEQSGVEIQHATLTWTDELASGKTLRFGDVGVRIENGHSGHVFGIIATPPRSLARQVEMRGNLRLQKNAGKLTAVGSIYASASDTNFAQLRTYVPVPEALRAGLGNLRAWIDIDSTVPSPAEGAGNPIAAFSAVRAITADIHLIDTKAQLSPDVAQLNISRLAGRIEYKAQEGGYTVGSTALALRTREGVTLPPADFSLTLQSQTSPATAKGEITGSGIDLHVMAALLEYFPVPSDIRAFAARFGPRGVVRKSSFAWTGYLDKPLTYRIKGEMTDFALNADGKLPGVTGFTGTVDGDEKGGKFIVASKNLQINAPTQMRAPLKFDSFESDGNWKITADAIHVDLARLAFANPEVAGDLAGRYSRFHADGPRAKEEKGPGSLDIKGRLTRAKAVAVANYLPNAASQTREYIEWAVRGGDIVSAEFSLKGEIFEFPFHQGKGGNFRLAANVKDVDFRYAEGWPVAENIAGELVFENTGFKAKIESGQFFNAKLKATTIEVDDFAAKPYMLSIQGETAARGEDVARFLRESPLINGVGAFTKSVAIEGPGNLSLALKIPIRGPESGKVASKISGTYTLRGGQAKPVFGPMITGLNGSVSFTESGVKSSGLAGIAYGSPISVAIMSGNEGVVTEFAGRVDVAQLGSVLPFAMPQQVAGTTDISGRIAVRDGGVDIAVESNLIGVTSGLPAPLAKRGDEMRKLRLLFSNTGLPNEKISVMLAGNTNAPSTGGATATATLADTPESRIDARFQRRIDASGNAQFRGGIASVGVPLGDAPIPEGLWFAGNMPLLDFDSWREAFSKFYPLPVANATSQPGRGGGNNNIQISGFDLKLGGLVAYGRPFDAMTLKGRHGGDDWRLTVDSDDAVGDVSWRAGAFNDRGAVRARLQKLVLADEVPQTKSANANPIAAPATREADFPALDIIADKFTLKDHELGKLELRATPMGENWRIDQLVISTGHAKLEMDGLWERVADAANPAGKSRTTMQLKLDTTNLNALFNQFGFGDYVKGGNAKLEGQLSWPGHIYQFGTAKLSGNFKINAADGRFAKIEPGAGKLLGLMSLQSLPRRITLDFRDIFSEGLAFSKIEGDVMIASGIMSTDNFEIKGPAALIRTAGEISLPTETVNLKMKVAPLIGEGAALGAGVFLTPIAGVVTYAASKLLEGALSYELSVTGPWDNPQSVQLKKNAPAIPAIGAVDPAKKTP